MKSRGRGISCEIWKNKNSYLHVLSYRLLFLIIEINLHPLETKEIDTEWHKRIAEQIKNGDEQAFAYLYQKHNRPLYWLAFRYLKSKSMAEDAVQEIFFNFWIKRDRLDSTSNIKSLIYTSLKNYTLNVLRNEGRAIAHNYKILNDSEMFQEDEYLEFDPENKHEKVKVIIDNLSPRKKEIFELKMEGVYSNEEIADKLNISVNTVKATYAQIVKELKELALADKSTLLIVTLLFLK